MGSDIKQAASHILFSIFSPPPCRRSKTKPGGNYGDDLRCLKKKKQSKFDTPTMPGDSSKSF